MAYGFIIRKNQYYDSLFLMGVNKRLSESQNVQQTAVLMGSENNKKLLADIGIKDVQIDAAQPNDLIVAVVAEEPETINAVLGKIDAVLNAEIDISTVINLHTFEEGLAQKPNANLVVISIPGEYAAHEVRKALNAGLHVFLFSDLVSMGDELELKQLASQKGLLLMGPDCGTSIIGGVGLGFANSVRRGSIGVVGATGTGLQEFTCQVHNAGLGISHAIGVGSHDLSDKIGGRTTFAALDALESDPQTQIIAVISKPPGVKTLTHLMKRLEGCNKPVICCLPGTDIDENDRSPEVEVAHTIDDAVRFSLARVSGIMIQQPARLSPDELACVVKEKNQWSLDQKYIRGLFAGGTFCYQTQAILHDGGIIAYSNSPLESNYKMDHPDYSQEHCIVDMGDDYYTTGKPHPMIDGTIRRQRILTESRDPQVAILMLDFILGYNVSMEPVGELLDAIIEAKQIVLARGGHLTIVASICGTEGDPQDSNLQTRMLQDAGVLVFQSNARAAAFCCELLIAR